MFTTAALALSIVLQDPSAAAVPTPPVARLTWVVHAYASWSPDDRKLVYQSNASGNWDLYVMDADGSGVERLVASPAADITPVWSPDGGWILFVSERDGNREVYVCAADGSGATNLTKHPAHDLHPVWSADGERVLFSSNRDTSGPDDYDIWEMKIDGGELRRITSGPDVDTYASWSPDGRRILTRRVVEGDNEVFVMDADGTNAVNLTRDPASYDGWPVWSPDGRRIAFAGGPPGASPHRIYWMNPDGTDRRALTDFHSGLPFVYDTQPCFSHDGKRLVFTRYRMGERESSELCVLDVEHIG